MKIKTLLLGTALASLSGYSAYAQSFTSGPRYMPRPAISNENYNQTHRTEDYMDTKSYRQYEQREPCQGYRALPRNYIDNCLPIIEEEIVEHAEHAAIQIKKPEPQKVLLPVVHSYTLLFDFDKSVVRPDEIETLDRVTREIDKYEPQQITVTGYTDSSGKSDYNQDLSRRREQAVSKALLERGIENQTLEREARGEYDQAVKTADNTRNQENRRVVIDFRR